MADFARRRQRMVEHQLRARGIRDQRVLDAFLVVPREAFVPESQAEFAYEDSPLPIAAGQTISQPYIVALMAESLLLAGNEIVLDVGTGSGYAAAILSRLAKRVYTIERHRELTDAAQRTFAAHGYDNIAVACGDGTLGWPEHAPYDAIAVAAGGPYVPTLLREQLAMGGRLVIPIGSDVRVQRLIRETRVGKEAYRQDDLGGVQFVPLIGKAGWRDTGGAPTKPTPAAEPVRAPLRDAAALVAEANEPFTTVGGADVDGMLDRIGQARVVLLGEATHGTSEFYRMRAHITRELVAKKGFKVIALEADWPDAARIDHYVRDRVVPAKAWTAFSRFPTWMWRNQETRDFTTWLREHNASLAPENRTCICGLDLYSLYRSVHEVLAYLELHDPGLAKTARIRYGCLTPWERDPATYGRAALSPGFRLCENDVVAVLKELLDRQVDLMSLDDAAYLDAVQNARLVANAEKYYRVMYYGAAASWNLRDQHMFDTLRVLLDFWGPEARAVVWAHNSHIGNAAATEMSARGEFNIGQLCRQAFGNDVYAIGFGTHTGTVAAASDWDGPMAVKRVRPSHPESYERICHDSTIPAFLLPLRHPRRSEVAELLTAPRLERAIGVIYRPETELQSHYFQASLPQQFDEYVWFDESHAVTPLTTELVPGVPETYPFGV